MNDIYFGEEDAKYVKPKPKKKVKKSKHKHKYVYCAANILNRHIFNKALVEYCSECGKINNVFFFPNNSTIDRLIKQNRVFDVEDDNDLFYMKYVPIVKE